MRIPPVLVIASALALIGACSDNNSGTGNNAQSGGDAGTSNAASGDNPNASCAAYLECVSIVAPAELAADTQAYGPNGTCWSGADQRATDCGTACLEAMGKLSTEFQNVAACGSTSSTISPEANPYGAVYPTANLGYLPRHGTVPGNVIANYKFLGYLAASDAASVLDTTKPPSTVALASYFDPQQNLGPNGTGIKVIHLSVAAAWSMPSGSETDDIENVAADLAAQGVVFIQALDDGPEQGDPATPSDLTGWIAKHNSSFTEVLDPGLRNLGEFFDAASVPFNANIDARSMEILSAGVGAPANITQDVTNWVSWVNANAPSGS